MTAAVLTVANGDQKLEQFLKTQGNCQADCLDTMMKPTFEALYGKLGEEFVGPDEKHKHEDFFFDALSGAFRACYPHPPLVEVRQVAETIFAGLFSNLTFAASHETFPPGITCPNEGYEEAFPLDEFLNSFHSAIRTVIASKPHLQKLFDKEAKDCQKTCLQQTVPVSAMTLFLTNNYNADNGLDALTGAIHACLPGFPHEDIAALVSDTSDAMDDAEEAAMARRYSKFQDQYFHKADTWEKRYKDLLAKSQRNDFWEGVLREAANENAETEQSHEEEEEEMQEPEGFSFFSICSVIVAVSLALFLGVVTGRRFRPSGEGKFVSPHKTYQKLATFGANTFGATTFGRKEEFHAI